jgi:carboxypeptidase Q
MRTAAGVLLVISLSTLATAAEPLYETYRETADKLINAALEDTAGYEKLSYLCDRIGNRISGSPALERAIQWAAVQMKKDGFVNISTPAVKVPHWVRGNEIASIVEPVRKPLHMLGLGGSIATPKEGITGEVVPVDSFDALESRGRANVEGKIVLYNVPFTNYFQTVQYRSQGASRAARLGALAALVRSVTPVSLQTPHTGAMEYAAGAPKIPAAAVSIEDATMIERLAGAGNKVVVHLAMEARTLPDADSANVIGEILGRDLPEEIVVIGGHLDSWDVGQGAEDDGAGCVTALEAAALINRLRLKLRRTIRVVFWTNEENGLAGGKAYREWVGSSFAKHVAAIEMDGGAEKPVGFGFGDFVHGSDTSVDDGIARLQEIGKLLERLGAGEIHCGGGGADISPLTRDGVPGLGLITVGTHYFDWHHTDADTVDKIKPQELRLNIAAMAVMSYVLADMPDRLPGHLSAR